MKITEQSDLSKWPATFCNRPHVPYTHFIEGVYHSPHGTVEVLSWVADPVAYEQLKDVLTQPLAEGRERVYSAGGRSEQLDPLPADAHKGTPYTRLRIVIGGIGWQSEEMAYYPPARLARLASAFANLAREAAGAQQQFVSDGAGMVSMAISFARELDQPPTDD